MSPIPAIAAVAAMLFAGTAQADEAIRAANNQESLSVGLGHLHTSDQAQPTGGSVVLNEGSGYELQLGYDTTRTRTLFGMPGFYTKLQVLLGGAQMNYAGTSHDPSTGAAGPNNGPYNLGSELVQVRAGRTWEFGPGQRLALTPYAGLRQQAWLRDSSTYARFTGYNHFGADVGVLGQAALTRTWVLGLDAGLGRTFGGLQFDGHNLVWPPKAAIGDFSLYVDHRTDADWHQRLSIRQDVVRYPEPPSADNIYEPRRRAGLSVGLEFGTELDLYKGLFY